MRAREKFGAGAADARIGFAGHLHALRGRANVVTGARGMAVAELGLRDPHDRIPIGEVRGGAKALDLIKARGTGHPDGVGTIHAGTALSALRCMEQWVEEAVVRVPRALIAETT